MPRQGQKVKNAANTTGGEDAGRASNVNEMSGKDILAEQARRSERDAQFERDLAERTGGSDRPLPAEERLQVASDNLGLARRREEEEAPPPAEELSDEGQQ
eukprot:tig00020723_g13490.t1